MTDCFLSPDRLSAYADASLPESDRAGIEEHVAGCARCQAQLEWLRTLARDTAALPRSLEPTRELWSGIAPRLGPRRRVVQVDLRVLAVAAVILIMLTAGAVDLWFRRQAPFTPIAHQPPVPVEQNAANTDPAAAVAALVIQVQRLEQSLPPETKALVTAQLGQIDAAIKESEAALAGARNNVAIEHMLEARYQQRLMLLEQARRVSRSS